jgi:hypothetical protein
MNLSEIAEGLNAISDNADAWSPAELRQHAQALRVAVDAMREPVQAIVHALMAPRNRFGRLDPSLDATYADASGRLRPHFLAIDPPHGGEDIADQCSMILQRMAGLEIRSTWDRFPRFERK